MSEKLVGILDYGTGNISSLLNCLQLLGFNTKIIRKEIDLGGVSTVILPGVGSMNFAMQNIKKNNLDVLIHKIFIRNKIRIIGICLGMQLFYEFSEEGNTPCLGLIKGKVKKFPNNFCHVGWNLVQTGLLDDIENKYKNFYFNHSFYVPYKKNNLMGVTRNITEFSSIVSKGSFFGLQFHPEKSQLIGRKLLSELII
jgi:glutamine amidotransferase